MAKIITLIVGAPKKYPTGCERIASVWDAIKWRLGSLPRLDASVNEQGHVTLFMANGRLVI